MTSTAQPTTEQEPNYFTLDGSGIHVTYTTSQGPLLTYQDQQQMQEFSGEEIRTVASDLGTLVSVTTARTVDTGSTSFTVLIPRVRLQKSDPAHVVTLGITALHRPTIGMPFVGQLDTYQQIQFTGTAQFIKQSVARFVQGPDEKS